MPRRVGSGSFLVVGPLFAVCVACTPGGAGGGAGAGGGIEGGAPPIASEDGGRESDASTVDRGPRTLDIAGDPNGLAWSAKEGLLYIADDNGNRILRLRESTFEQSIPLPTAPASGPGLGQVLAIADGRLVVPRFGFGSAGDVVVIASGSSRALGGLDATRRRIGLAESPSGKLFVTFFTGGSGSRVGTVAELDVEAATETEVASGFRKPVGVLATDDALLVSDQDAGEILRIPIADPSARTIVARIASPDLMAWGPDGSFFVGSKGGAVSRVAADGSIARIGEGFREVRGVAWDDEARRLFVVDHDTASTNARHLLHVLPVDP